MGTNGHVDGPPWTPKEVAALERCSAKTIYQALWSGALKGYRSGGNRGGWRITAEALEEYRSGEE